MHRYTIGFITLALLVTVLAVFYGVPTMNDLPDENAEMYYNPEAEKDVDTELQRKFEKRLFAIEGVVGVGMGQSVAGEDAIIVYVRDRSVVSELPNEIDGHTVVVEVTGDIDAL